MNAIRPWSHPKYSPCIHWLSAKNFILGPQFSDLVYNARAVSPLPIYQIRPHVLIGLCLLWLSLRRPRACSNHVSGKVVWRWLLHLEKAAGIVMALRQVFRSDNNLLTLPCYVAAPIVNFSNWHKGRLLISKNNIIGLNNKSNATPTQKMAQCISCQANTRVSLKSALYIGMDVAVTIDSGLNFYPKL